MSVRLTRVDHECTIRPDRKVFASRPDRTYAWWMEPYYSSTWAGAHEYVDGSNFDGASVRDYQHRINQRFAALIEAAYACPTVDLNGDTIWLAEASEMLRFNDFDPKPLNFDV